MLALGELDVDAGNGVATLRWLEPAVAHKPRDYDARYGLAKALLYAGQGERARPHFEFAAQARLAQGQVKALTQYVADHPDSVESRYEIGVALLEYGEAAEGLRWLQSVLQYAPDHVRAQEALAEFHAQRSTAAGAATTIP